MSRTKSTGLIKAAVRPKSDAGHAGWRPKVDMAASMQINGLRLAAPVEPKPKEAPPIDPGSPRETAKVTRELESFGAVAAPAVETVDPRQLGLFASLGVKV